MIDRVLVATDGSDNARHAEETGCELAVALGADLVFAHTVVERPSEEEVGGMKDRNSNRLLHTITPPSGRDQPAKRADVGSQSVGNGFPAPVSAL